MIFYNPFIEIDRLLLDNNIDRDAYLRLPPINRSINHMIIIIYYYHHYIFIIIIIIIIVYYSPFIKPRICVITPHNNAKVPKHTKKMDDRYGCRILYFSLTDNDVVPLLLLLELEERTVRRA